MASLVLGSVCTTVGTIIGGPLGGQTGSTVGSYLDGALFGSGGANDKVGNIEDLRVQVSREGVVVPRT